MTLKRDERMHQIPQPELEEASRDMWIFKAILERIFALIDEYSEFIDFFQVSRSTEYV